MDHVQIVTDQIIAGIGYLAISACGTGYILIRYYQRSISGILFIIAGFSVLSVLIYGALLEPRTIAVREERIDIAVTLFPSIFRSYDSSYSTS